MVNILNNLLNITIYSTYRGKGEGGDNYFSKIPMLICRFCRDTAGSDDIMEEGDIGDIGDEGGAEKPLSAGEGSFPLGTERSEKSPALCSSKPCAWCDNDEKSWS